MPEPMPGQPGGQAFKPAAPELEVDPITQGTEAVSAPAPTPAQAAEAMPPTPPPSGPKGPIGPDGGSAGLPDAAAKDNVAPPPAEKATGDFTTAPAVPTEATATNVAPQPPQPEVKKGLFGRIMDRLSAKPNEEEKAAALKQAGVVDTGEHPTVDTTDPNRMARLKQVAAEKPYASNNDREFIDGAIGTVDPKDPTKPAKALPEDNQNEAA